MVALVWMVEITRVQQFYRVAVQVSIVDVVSVVCGEEVLIENK